jgi:hypothetical protein
MSETCPPGIAPVGCHRCGRVGCETWVCRADGCPGERGACRRCAECAAAATLASEQAAALAERARIVAWLRSEPTALDDLKTADAIERGEHEAKP